jgi:hypothetical protein
MAPRRSAGLLAAALLLLSCRPAPEGTRPVEGPDGSPNRLSARETAEGWQLLFDGATTEGWRAVNATAFPAVGWEVRDGALVANAATGVEAGAGGDIVTRREFGEFDLRWEWRLDTKGGNSGVKYCVREGEGDGGKHGIGLEYQILDDPNHEWMLDGRMSPGDFHTLGGLYELYAPSPEKQAMPLGEWNSSRIVARRGAVQHWLNGALVLEYDRGSPDFLDRVARSKFKDFAGFGRHEIGRILLQDHGSAVRFRNLKIRHLSGS